MTIDEAIFHCEENAKKEEKCGNYGCASEHEQLANWLKKLKELTG